MKRIAWIAPLALLIVSCSTVKNLPEGEVLYTGIKDIEIKEPGKGDVADNAVVEVTASLDCPPNNSFFGSSSLRTPFPFGLWWYNSCVNSNSKIGKWCFDHFAATPVVMSQVNPKLRCQIATNVLHNFGYFHGWVNSEIIKQRNPRKQKVSYTVGMGLPFVWDSITYMGFSPTADSLIHTTTRESLLQKGAQFTVSSLDGERTRLSNLFRDHGYYYFQPGYITYQADTLHAPGQVDLHITPAEGLSPKVTHPWSIGKVSIAVMKQEERMNLPHDTLKLRDMTYYYSGKKAPVRPGIFLRRLGLKHGEYYSQDNYAHTLSELSRLNIFSSLNFNFTPRDSTATCDSLDLFIFAQLDKLYALTLEANVTSKSNSQVGPGIKASLERKNIFGGGETLKGSVSGSYEWQTNGDMKGRQAVINSWEIGADLSLKFPRLYMPFVNNRRINYSTSTSYHLYADQLNRSGFFKMVSAGGEALYTLTPYSTTTHVITPFHLTYDMLQRTTAKFDSIVNQNRALKQSFRNQFIPAMIYSYTYDNNKTSHRNKSWWQTTVMESGNVVSLAYMALGKGWNDKDKEIVYNPYAQFLKATTELRQQIKIDSRQVIATRLFAGIIKPYGNSSVAPYSEQFYAGGANDIRAFTIRTIGPGSYHPDENSKYSYMDETGDLKLEANVEYRFKLFGNLYGALFADAGNVWLLDKSADRPGGELTLNNFINEVAFGVGPGLRYDMEFLVVRIDLGVPLHAPYDTGKSGYFNISNYWDNMRLHFAIGYPF